MPLSVQRERPCHATTFTDSAAITNTARLAEYVLRARYAGQELLDLARAQSHSAAGRRDRRRRQWLLEGSFGRAATQHGFKRARWRGLKLQGIQDYLIASVQNLLILLHHGQLPPRVAMAAFKSSVGLPPRVRKTASLPFQESKPKPSFNSLLTPAKTSEAVPF